MRFARGARLTVCALGIALLAPPAAGASCAVGFEPEPPARVVFDAVVLSGTRLSDGRGLAGKVKLAVLAYRRGSGPRIVRTRAAAQLFLGRTVGLMSETPEWHPGQVVRIEQDRPPRGLQWYSVCGEVQTAPRGLMRPVARAGDVVARAGRGGVLCVHVGRLAECTVRRRAALTFSARGGETVIAAWGPALRRLEAGGQVAAASAESPAVLRLPGELTPEDVRVRLTYADGSGELRQGGASRRAHDGGWVAYRGRSRDRECAAVGGPEGAFGYRCLRLPGRGFFAVERPSATSPLVAFGLARSEVTELTVDARPVVRARVGGAFLAVLPAETDARAVVLRATYADGSVAEFSGRPSGRF